MIMPSDAYNEVTRRRRKITRTNKKRKQFTFIYNFIMIGENKLRWQLAQSVAKEGLPITQANLSDAQLDKSVHLLSSSPWIFKN